MGALSRGSSSWLSAAQCLESHVSRLWRKRNYASDGPAEKTVRRGAADRLHATIPIKEDIHLPKLVRPHQEDASSTGSFQL